MAKTLRMSFTGTAVLTPEYPDNLMPIDGPLTAVMPGGRHRRPSPFPQRQVAAQFAFLVFPYAQLVQTAGDARDADYKYPDPSTATTGLCFLEREDWILDTPALDQGLSFDQSPATGSPTPSSTGTKWIPKWSDFANGGRPWLDASVLRSEGDYVRVIIGAGTISAGFVSEGAARISFDYGDVADPEPHQYAQEIVVTLTFDDATPFVTLRSLPFSGAGQTPATDTSTLTFAWYDSPVIDLLFGNGSLESILNVLKGPFAGQDHEGDYDTDFAVLYDIMHVDPDRFGRQPLPRIKSLEILKIPCVSTMAGTSTSTGMSVTAGMGVAPDVHRTPKSRRTR